LRTLTQPNIGGLTNAEDLLAAAGGSPAFFLHGVHTLHFAPALTIGLGAFYI